MEFPKTELEFEKAWSYTSGRHSELALVVLKLEQEVGRLFIIGRDEQAHHLRNMLKDFSEKKQKLSEEVDAFIYEAANRRNK